MDTEVDRMVKEALIEDTFHVLFDKSDHFLPISCQGFQKLFCFPFPEELFGEEFLNNQEASQLLRMLNMGNK